MSTRNGKCAAACEKNPERHAEDPSLAILENSCNHCGSTDGYYTKDYVVGKTQYKHTTTMDS